MKKPRIEDFDPNAKEEPVLKFSMGNMPAIEKSYSKDRVVKGNPASMAARNHGTTVPTMKRVMRRRHPFDIYEDQYEALRRLSLDDMKQGGIGSMSEMAREAIDAYLKKR